MAKRSSTVSTFTAAIVSESQENRLWEPTLRTRNIHVIRSLSFYASDFMTISCRSHSEIFTTFDWICFRFSYSFSVFDEPPWMCSFRKTVAFIKNTLMNRRRMHPFTLIRRTEKWEGAINNINSSDKLLNILVKTLIPVFYSTFWILKKKKKKQISFKAHLARVRVREREKQIEWMGKQGNTFLPCYKCEWMFFSLAPLARLCGC